MQQSSLVCIQDRPEACNGVIKELTSVVAWSCSSGCKNLKCRPYTNEAFQRETAHEFVAEMQIADPLQQVAESQKT